MTLLLLLLLLQSHGRSTIPHPAYLPVQPQGGPVPCLPPGETAGAHKVVRHVQYEALLLTTTCRHCASLRLHVEGGGLRPLFDDTFVTNICE
jgi:hypothetical protein